MRRNILKLLTVVGTTLGINSLLNRNVYAFLKKPIDLSTKTIAPNEGMISQAERIIQTENAQNLNDEVIINAQEESQVQGKGINMNMDKIKQLQEELNEQMEKAIGNSNFPEFLNSKGLIEKTLKVEVTLDLNLIRNTDFITDKELQDALREMPGSEITLRCCYPCGLQWCNC